MTRSSSTSCYARNAQYLFGSEFQDNSNYNLIVNFADTDEAVESGFYLARLSLIGS